MSIGSGQVFVPISVAYVQCKSIVTVLARNIAHIGQLLANVSTLHDGNGGATSDFCINWQPIGALTSLVRLFDGFRSVQGGPNNLSTLHPILVYVSSQKGRRNLQCTVDADLYSS